MKKLISMILLSTALISQGGYAEDKLDSVMSEEQTNVAAKPTLPKPEFSAPPVPDSAIKELMELNELSKEIDTNATPSTEDIVQKYNDLEKDFIQIMKAWLLAYNAQKRMFELRLKHWYEDNPEVYNADLEKQRLNEERGRKNKEWREKGGRFGMWKRYSKSPMS